MQKHKFLNIRGFSLVEVMVVGGILTIIGLAVMSLISNTTKSQRGLQAKDTMRDFAVEIRSTLSDKTACINTFAAKNLSTDEATVTVVKDAGNNAKYSAGTTYMNGLINFKNLVMREFVADATNPNTGIAKLFVYADKNGNTSGVKTIHHVLSAQIEMDAAKNILKCIAVGGLSDSLWQVSTANPNDIFFNGGKVGIGTTSPTSRLVVVTDEATGGPFLGHYYGNSNGAYIRLRSARGTAAAPTFRLNDDTFGGISWGAWNGATIDAPAAAHIGAVATEDHTATASGTALIFGTTQNGTVATTGVERMRIDHNGNVGVGTTTPSFRLQISGGQLVVSDNGTAAAPAVGLADNNSGIFRTSAGGGLGFSVNGAERMRVEGSGNVGIGTTNPAVAKLQIEVPASGSPHVGVLVENKDTTVGAASFRLNRNDTSVQNNIVLYTTTAVPSYQWAFGQISAGTNNLEVVRNGFGPLQVWDVSNGNVGINTTTPQTKLDVNGPIRPGSATIGAACTAEGAFAYDSAAHKPIYCKSTGTWAQMGGASTSTLVTSGYANGANTVSCPAGAILTSCYAEVNSVDGQSMMFQQHITYNYTGGNLTGCSSAMTDSHDNYRLVAICIQ